MKYLLFSIILFIQGGTKNIEDYFKLFPYKGELTLQESEKNDITIDLPNAYIKIVDHGTEDYAFDSKMTFVYFVTAAKGKYLEHLGLITDLTLTDLIMDFTSLIRGNG